MEYAVEPVLGAVDSISILHGKADTMGIRRHRLVFPGEDSVTLSLTEFSRDYWAFSAYQAHAQPSESDEGVFRKGVSLVFFHGSFVGELTNAHSSLIPISFLKERLGMSGETLFQKPLVFTAFPLRGRIPNSESVIPRHFLGKKWKGPAFCVKYRCRGDTAIAFRGFPQDPIEQASWLARDWRGQVDTLNWPREYRFEGWDEFQSPLVFVSFPQGVAGISGCFDPILSRQTLEKMQKMSILWKNP